MGHLGLIFGATSHPTCSIPGCRLREASNPPFTALYTGSSPFLSNTGTMVTRLPSRTCFLWSILQPGVCCNIPYFLARYLSDYAVSSRLGIPICGGYFITRLARSYGVIISDITRSLNCMEGNKFTLGYLEKMRVVRNYRSHWGIVDTDYDDDGGEQPSNQPEQQPQPRP